MSPYRALICLALTHTLVDTIAQLVAPLWPNIEQTFQFSLTGLSIAFIVQSMPTSISQVIVGYIRDRRPTPNWLWLGPVMAAVFYPLLGVSTQYLLLFAMLIIGGFGIGAFHPEAAVLAGRLLPGHRARSLAVFMFGGSLGLAIGPILSGWIVRNGGLSTLAWLVGPCLILIFLLRWCGGLNAASRVTQPTDDGAVEARTATLSDMMDGRGWFALFLLLVCSLRLVPNMAMDKVLSFALSQRGFDEVGIGNLQAVFLSSASAGMFVMAWFFRPGWEKPFMIWCPLLGIPLLLLLSQRDLESWQIAALLVPAGMLLWGTVPATVSYAQQQFPRGAGLASALTMGMAWGFGGLIQAPITAWFTTEGRTPQHAFIGFVPCLFLAAIGAWAMPSNTPQSETG